MMYPMHNDKEISGLRSAGSGDRAKVFSDADSGVVSGIAKSQAPRWGTILGVTAVGLMGVAGWAEPVAALITFNAAPSVWNAGTGTFAGNTNATATLNASTGTDGFDNQFTSNFVRVGSRPAQVIGATNNTAFDAFAQTNTTFAQNLNMQSLGTAGREFVSLSFTYLFDGQETTPGSHNWIVELIRYNDVVNNPTNVTVVGAMTANLTSVQTPFQVGAASPAAFSTNEIFVNALNAGEAYGFRVTLNEVGTLSATNNTALGFNNVVVRAAVPYELETGLGLGAVGLFMAYRRLKKRASLKGTPHSVDAPMAANNPDADGEV